MHPSLTATCEHRKERIAGLLRQITMDAATSRIRGRIRVQSKPLRDRFLKGKVLGFSTRQSSVKFVNGSTLVKVRMPVLGMLALPVLQRSDQLQKIRLLGLNRGHNLIREGSCRAIDDQLFTFSLNHHAAPAKLPEKRSRLHRTTRRRCGRGGVSCPSVSSAIVQSPA